MLPIHPGPSAVVCGGVLPVLRAKSPADVFSGVPRAPVSTIITPRCPWPHIPARQTEPTPPMGPVRGKGELERAGAAGLWTKRDRSRSGSSAGSRRRNGKRGMRGREWEGEEKRGQRNGEEKKMGRHPPKCQCYLHKCQSLRHGTVI